MESGDYNPILTSHFIDKQTNSCDEKSQPNEASSFLSILKTKEGEMERMYSIETMQQLNDSSNDLSRQRSRFSTSDRVALLP